MTPEDIRQTIDQLTEMAEEMEASEMDYQSGEMVNYTYEGEEGVAMIESVREGEVTARVMAVAGDSYEPTDNVLILTREEISPMGGDSEEEEEGLSDDDPDSDNEEPIEEEVEDLAEEEIEEEELEKGVFVSWQSKYGDTFGIVRKAVSDEAVEIPETKESIEIKGNGALIEVVKDNNGWEETGVHVALHSKSLKVIEPLELKLRRLMIKAKDVEVKADFNNEEWKIGELHGIGSAYGRVDLGGDTVRPGAYTQTINHNQGKIQLMFDHGYKVSDVAGVAYLEDSEEGLKVKAKMPLDIDSVRDAYKLVKFMVEEGKPLGFSIGYRVVKAEPLENGVRELQEIALEEMTITPYPMDTYARITDAKSRKITYNTKRKGWQTVVKTAKPSTSDAPTGNQVQQGEYKSLTEYLTEIKTHIEENHV
jgi:HK97 family phage prohead protease